MIHRKQIIQKIEKALSRSRVVVLTGPRQCGKTTLARQFLQASSGNYFDLEDPLSVVRLSEPMTALTPLTGLIVIDEIQLRPDLFRILRVLCDRTPVPAKFLILGSASPALLRQTSESLTGRVEMIEIEGLSIADLGSDNCQNHWLKGGFPLSWTAASAEDSTAWRKSFLQNVLTLDLSQFNIRIPPQTLLRFWRMASHLHGSNWNSAEAAAAMETSQTTARHYLDLLTGFFFIRQLQPYFVNIGKRQIKSPRIYFRDTGLLHSMLGISTMEELLTHPKCGFSWEGYIIEEILKLSRFDNAWYWRTQNGAEADLLLERNGKLIAVECKRADAPRVTPSMRSVIADLKPEHLYVIYPGGKRYELNDNISAVPMHEFPLETGITGG